MPSSRLSSEKNSRKTIGRWLTLGCIGIAAYFISKDLANQWPLVGEVTRSQSLFKLGIALVGSCISISFSGLSLCFFYQGFVTKGEVLRPRLVGTYMVANLFRYVPGKVSTIIYLVQGSGLSKMPMTQATATMLASSILIGTSCAVVLTSSLPDFGIATVTLIPVLLFCGLIFVPKVHHTVLTLVQKKFGHRLSIEPGSFHPFPIAIGFGVLLIGWLFASCSLVILIQQTVALTPRDMILTLPLFPAAATAGFLVLTAPAGIGVREAVIVAFLTQMFTWSEGADAQRAAAFSLALLHRFVVTLSDLAMGGIGMLLQKGSERFQAAHRATGERAIPKSFKD